MVRGDETTKEEDFIMGRKIVFMSFVFCIGIVLLCFFPSISTAEVTYTAKAVSPKITISPKAVNLGSIGIGNTSAAKTIAIKGNGGLTVNSITLTGANATEFSQTNTCSTPSSDGSCTIVATFSPTTSVGKKSAIIHISSNDPKHSTVSVKLSGKADPKIDIAGTWNVKGKMKIKASAQGHSESVSETVPDEFIFSDDGSFSMIDMDGTWSQKGTNFVVNLDPDSISSYFEDNLAEETGFDISVDVTHMNFTGTLQKNGTIKGSFKLNMNFDIEDYDLHGTVTALATFTGTRSAISSLVKEEEQSQLPVSILDVIKEELDNAVRLYDRMP
jgi:hypothetical protein